MTPLRCLRRGLLAACLSGLLGGAAMGAPSAQVDAPAACPPPVPAVDTATTPADARDRGLLWALRRDGRVSYLFGTLHVGRLAWRQPGPRLKAALDSVDVLALELDVTDPQVLRELRLGIVDRDRVAQRLPASLRERLRQQVQRACLAPQALAGQHPAMQASTLAIVAAQHDGLYAAFGQEAVLAEAAQVRSRPVVSLETPARQLQVLLPGDDAQTQHFVRDTLAQLEDGRGRRVMRRLAEAWERGELDTLAQFESWCECITDEADRAALRRLNDERNPALAQAIAALHGRGQRVLAAVGALHMTGEQALPALLRAQGFEVQRLAFAP